MDLSLEDKVVIVTGGSRGLGRAVCLGLAAEGADLAVNYCSSQHAAQELVETIQNQYDVNVIAVSGDVAKSEDVECLFARCEKELGPVDVLVNNAGVWPTDFVKDMTEEAWDRTLDVNLKGTFLTCREAVRRWLDRKYAGRIINVSSAVAFLGSTTGHAHYAASKAGMVNFTVSLAREMGPDGICVNAVAPGMIRTDMAFDALEANEEKYLQRIPLRRIADPDEVADVVLFLASDRASYLTGATIDVSGGMLMR